MRATERGAKGRQGGSEVVEVKCYFGHKSEMTIKHPRSNANYADGFGLLETGWGVIRAAFAHFELEMTA